MATAFQDSWDAQAAAASVGFDWPSVDGVLDKLEEEIGEIRACIETNDREGAQREVGDLLLATVNTCRFLEVDPASALSEATARFSKRFSMVKNMLAREERMIESCSFDELNRVWERAKDRVG